MAAKKKTARKTTTKKKAAGKRAGTGAIRGKRKAAPAKKTGGLKPPKKKAPARKRAEKKVPEAPKVVPENPAALALARRAGELVLERKADSVVLLDVRGRASFADYLLVASGDTERQVAAMAEAVEVQLKQEGNRPISTEGHTPGQWVLLDYGDVVVHLFEKEARGFYDIEGMWPEVPREQLS